MIKILTAIASKESLSCLDDEPVVFGPDCGCSECECGCRNRMVGLKTYHNSTLFKVQEVDITCSYYEKQIFDYLCYIGMNEITTLTEISSLAHKMADDIFYITNQMQIGDIVEREDEVFTVIRNTKADIRERLKLKLSGGKG